LVSWASQPAPYGRGGQRVADAVGDGLAGQLGATASRQQPSSLSLTRPCSHTGTRPSTRRPRSMSPCQPHRRNRTRLVCNTAWPPALATAGPNSTASRCDSEGRSPSHRPPERRRRHCT
jgi:hypothetical protein